MEHVPSLHEAVERLPLGPLHDALGGVDAYLVGGTVRDLLHRGEPGKDVDIDIAIDADLEELLAGFDPGLSIEVTASHDRFSTATVLVEGFPVDLTRTRTETYLAPGALPETSPAGIEEDLARRDFTVNAMAVRLASPGELLDPFGGREDLSAGTLRVLHQGSFVDDPTRAIRAARYAARLTFVPDPETLELLRDTDLGTVSADRRRAELVHMAREPSAAEGFRLLAEWGLLTPPPGALELLDSIELAAAEPPWSETPEARTEGILLATEGGERAGAARRLGRAAPERPSEAVRLAAGHEPAELLLATAAGGSWIDRYLAEWCSTRLEIDGEDLLAAGIPEGPAIGAGLQGALERKLDGGLSGGREAELELALELARRAI